MVAIQIDNETAAALEQESQQQGVTVAEYLHSLVLGPSAPADELSWEDIEREFDALSSEGPQITSTFSREDIYSDHD